MNSTNPHSPLVKDLIETETGYCAETFLIISKCGTQLFGDSYAVFSVRFGAQFSLKSEAGTKHIRVIYMLQIIG